MSVCFTCGTVLPEEARCHVETHDEYLGRLGTHRGRCWNGRFPTAADLTPPVTKDEVQQARDRGAARYHHQLTLMDDAA